MKSFTLLLVAACVMAETPVFAQPGDFTIARLRYSGGGDWYNDPSAIPNLLQFIEEHTNVAVQNAQKITSALDEELFSYPLLFMTGHGRIALSDEEISRLRLYLTSGGFLYADDDYGMDEYFRALMQKIFPDKELVELPFSHEMYSCHFAFANGPPKIHEHDGKPPQGFGVFHEGRLVVYYTYETNISDGWASPEVHGDPPEKRLESLKMGTNIVIYMLTH